MLRVTLSDFETQTSYQTFKSLDKASGYVEKE